MNKKIYTNKEEMKKDLIGLREETKNELIQSIEEIKKGRRKKYIKIGLILIAIALFIKAFFGTIHLNSFFTYSKNRLYEIYINDDLITVDSTDHYKLNIIPWLLDYNQYNTTVYYGDSDPYYITSTFDKYILSATSYSCYSKNSHTQLRCNSESDYFLKEKNIDTVYKNLYIRKNGNPEIVKYDGPFINDITQYITQEEGWYFISIISSYGRVENRVTFTIRNIGIE